MKRQKYNKGRCWRLCQIPMSLFRFHPVLFILVHGISPAQASSAKQDNSQTEANYNYQARPAAVNNYPAGQREQGNPYDGQNNSPEQQRDHYSASETDTWVIIQAIAAWASVLVAGATLLAAFFAVRWAKRSAEASQASLQHSRETFEISTRPYVVLEWGAIRADLDTGVVLWPLVIVNYGQLPARITDARCGCVNVAGSADLTDRHIDDALIKGRVIPSKSSITLEPVVGHLIAGKATSDPTAIVADIEYKALTNPEGKSYNSKSVRTFILRRITDRQMVVGEIIPRSVDRIEMVELRAVPYENSDESV